MRAVFTAIFLCMVLGIELVRYGWANLWITLGPRTKRRAGRLHAKGAAIARFCSNTGPTFTKIGQILSSRPDILEPEIIEELAMLQDRVPPVPFALIQKIIEGDLGGPLEKFFLQFEEKPIAAASVAQVHRAWLHDGRALAVKVQRPGMARKFESDISVLNFFAAFTSLVPGVKNLRLPEQVDEFGRALHSQLDFRGERDNNRLFAALFRDVPWVRLPAVHEELSGPRVITMEFVEGKKVPDYIRSRNAPDTELAERLYTLYLLMCIERHTLHADLHPGNLLIDNDRRIVMLDTGLVYAVPRHYAQKYMQLLLAFGTFDGHLLTRAYLADRTDIDEDRRRIIGDKTHEMTQKVLQGDVREIDLADVWQDLLALLREQAVTFDRELTLIAVTDSTFSGMARQLDPEFDFFQFMIRETARLIFEKKVLPADDPYLKEALRIQMLGGAKKVYEQKQASAAAQS
ncbi:MAG: AarF/ABC1/UbiB kinase family protein [Deltaproteobacteria bacterium]|nr:AarF/ABC1/UbiB kinase family protein [Deltaproteobacteria bacterium]